MIIADSNLFIIQKTFSTLQIPILKRSIKKENCSEWVNFSNNQVKQPDVFSIQYETTPDSFLTAYKNNYWKSFTGNSFISWLQKKGNHAALEYMALAKQSEVFFIQPADPWDTTAAIPKEQIESVSHIAVHALSEENSTFLKERYAFQSVKLIYYTNDEKANTQLTDIYDHYLKDRKTIVASWALVYYAMTLKNNDARTLTLLKAFDKTEEKKRFCYQRISEQDLLAVKKKTNDPKTLALINTVYAIKNKGQAIQNIKAVYESDPNSKYIPLLISREVNKLENWLWSPEILGFYDNYRPDLPEGSERNHKKIRAADMKYLIEFRSWLESSHLISAKPYEQLALIHLLNMEKRYADAQNLIDKLPAKLNSRLEIQRQTEQLIVLSQSNDIIKPDVQQKIALSIKKMMTLDPIFKHQIDSGYSMQEQYDRNENEDDLAELLVLLSNSCKKAGDMVTAALLYNKSNITLNEYSSGANDDAVNYRRISFLDRNGTPDDIDKLLQFKNSSKKTLFQQLITPAKWGTEDFYKDLKGTMLIRRKQFREALIVFGSMKQTFWDNNYEYKDYLPTTSIISMGDIIPGETNKVKDYAYISKKLIVKDIVDLQEKLNNATDDKVKAGLNYKLANCYFNISYYGKAWMMYSYGKSYNDWGYDNSYNYNWASYSFYPNSIKYGDDYYGCKNAMDAYNISLSLTKDNELAAKCLLSLNFCKTVASVYSTEYKKPVIKTDYLKILVTKYKHTYNFKEAAMICADVREYVDGKMK